MKILAKVEESEFLTREFWIDCGLGTQFISWLAQTACLKFGQVHYPKGIYIPNLLVKKDDESNPPHPRRRIHEVFQDGDTVIVKLKNRAVEQDLFEEEWYEQAFGKKQNLMTVKLDFTPEVTDKLKKGKFDIYADIEYNMFEEMEGEFVRADFKQKDRILLDEKQLEGSFYYQKQLELPYGDIKVEYKYGNKNASPDELNITPVPEEEKNIEVKMEPVPISMKKLKEMHQIEEEENKKREAEARLAQKRLEEEKAKLRYDQQQQIAKQEQNTAQLRVFFEAMNLGFHTGEEDFNASMSTLSIYHQELMDYFKFYSQMHEQKFKKEENTIIVLQSFIHFMNLMGIAKTKEEAQQASAQMNDIDGVNTPFSDTLNVMNGLNYAQFLEAILRIAYWKKNNSDHKGSVDGFKITLETLFADAELDIKKKAKQDQTYSAMLDLANQGFFEQNFDLLGAIFTEKGIPRGDILELSKSDFVGILKDSGILILKKEDKKEDDEGKKKAAQANATKPAEAKKPEEEQKTAPVIKFDEMDVHAAIQLTHSFDDNQLNYINFIESLIRIAQAYPFTEEQLADMVSFELKMMFFIQKLEDKYKGLKSTFISNMDKRTMSEQYQPRVVVDEDEDDDMDVDN